MISDLSRVLMSYLEVRPGGHRHGEAPGAQGDLWPRLDSQQDGGGLLSEIRLTAVLPHFAAEGSKYPQLAARFLP